MNPAQEFQPMMDEIFREKVLRARATLPAKRFLEGFDLLETGLSLMRDGVRAQHPEFTAEQIDTEISRRFALVRRIEEQGIYRPV